jgi:2-haloacid dehalogenase
MLEAGIRNSQLDGVFDHVLSTDRVKVYKPDRRLSPWALTLLVEAGPKSCLPLLQDGNALDAKSFEYPTFRVNRQNQPAEELGVTTDARGGYLNDLRVPSGLRHFQAHKR